MTNPMKQSLLSIVFCLIFQAAFAQPAVHVDLSLPSVVFTDPDQLDTDKSDQSILNQIRRLIDATPAGEEITVCVFKFEQEDLAISLIQAQERGVKVRVILNKGETSKKANKEIKELLESGLTDFSYLENDISDKGIIHNKFILFSRLQSAGKEYNHIILQTSSNFQAKGTKKLQDMLLFSSQELYFCYLDFWFQIKTLGNTDQMDHYRYFSCSDRHSNEAYFFPKRRDKESFGKDEVLRILENIENPGQAEIRFAHGKWEDNRYELTEALEDLQEEGAKVEVVTNADLDKDIRKELNELHQGIYYLEEDINMHTKFFLIEQGDKREVWTGSHNLTKRSLRENFEVLLKVNDPVIYQQYRAYFDRIKALCSP